MKKLRVRWSIVIGGILAIVVMYYSICAAYHYGEHLKRPIKQCNWRYASSLAVTGDFDYVIDGTEVKIIVHSMQVDRRELTCRVNYYNLYAMYKQGVSVDMLLDLYNDYLSEPDFVVSSIENRNLVEYADFWNNDYYIEHFADYLDYDEYQTLVKLVLSGYRFDADGDLIKDEFDNYELFGEYIYWEDATEEQIQIACDYVNQNKEEVLYKTWYHLEGI